MVAELSRSFASQTALSKILLSFMKKKPIVIITMGFFISTLNVYDQNSLKPLRYS